MDARLTALLLGLGLAACNGGTLSNGSHSAEGTSTDRESDAADSPQQVSGAFLTCGADTATSGSGEPFGCRFADAKGQKLPGTLTAPKVDVSLQDGTHLQPAPTSAPAASRWHVTFSLPAGASTTVVGLAVSGQLGGKPVASSTKSLNGAAAGAPGPTSGATLTIFLTSETYEPGGTQPGLFNNGGDADGKCQTLATAAGLTAQLPNWHAILSQTNQSAGALIGIDGTVLNMKGETVAQPATFWGPHTALLNIDEKGVPHGQGEDAFVWTGSTSDGGTAANCEDWAVGATAASATAVSTGVLGKADSPDQWLNAKTVPCGPSGSDTTVRRYHLYCISQ